jgi:hypothetical protein
VHRWDADGVVGAPEPVGSAPAEAGLDELVDCFLPLQFGYGAVPPARVVELTATDVRRSWTLAGCGSPGAAAGPAAALSGSASDLLPALLHRIPPDRLIVTGDESAALEWVGFVPAF